MTVQSAIAHDVSPPLSAMSATISKRDADADKDKGEPDDDDDMDAPENALAPAEGTNAPTAATNAPAPVVIPPAAVAVEQTNHGSRPAVELLTSFDGLGASFTGPQGKARLGNPSDNTLAVGPDYIVQIVNTRLAVYTKKGKKYDTTGKVLLGPVETGNVFKGFGDGERSSGDAVARYDQLANRWLIVMPIFRRLPNETNVPAPIQTAGAAMLTQPAVTNQPGDALALYQPPAVSETSTNEAGTNNATGTNGPARGRRGGGGGIGGRVGPYAMCYAVSTGPDPLGSYYRYEFIRPLFPDYPRRFGTMVIMCQRALATR